MKPRIPTELRALRELFHACDPAPERVVNAAYTASARVREWCGSGVLELVSDSADAPVPSRVRGPRDAPEPRVLTFMTPGRVIEMDLVPALPGLLRATGMVISKAGHAAAGELVVRHPEGELVGALDEHGTFRVEDIPSGPLSLVFRTARSEPVIADWLVC